MRLRHLVLLAAAALACSRERPSPRAARAVSVRAVRVACRDLPLEYRAPGRIVSSQSVVVRAEVSGRITAVHFTEGQDVKQGDLLLEIDRRPYVAALAQARAELEQDRAKADNARADASRYRELFAQELVADQQHAAAVAEAAALEAAVAADRAAVDRAELDVDRCAIRAPAAGRTGRLLVHAGNTIAADSAQPLLVIERRRPVYAELSVPERHLSALRDRGAAAAPAWVRTASGVEREGTLEFIDNAVDPATGTILVRVRLPNRDDALWPGQGVDVRLQLEVRSGARLVPAAAVAQGQRGDYAYVVTPQRTAELRPVTAEPAGDAELLITRGLAPDELVVVEGQLRLTPGAQVELVGEQERR